MAFLTIWNVFFDWFCIDPSWIEAQPVPYPREGWVAMKSLDVKGAVEREVVSAIGAAIAAESSVVNVLNRCGRQVALQTVWKSKVLRSPARPSF